MVVTANGVKPPYVITRRRAVLKFEAPEYAGIHIEARLDVDLKTFLDLQQLAGQSDNNPAGLREAFTMFGEQILESWNLRDDDGTVLSPDAMGFLALPPALGTAILGAWSEAVSTAGEALASA